MRTKTFTLIVMLLYIIGIQAQISKVNVTTDGPGVVDEYYVLNSDGSKQVKLKAVPSKFLGNVTFDGWNGDATGTSEELIVDADKTQNIHAVFTYHRPVKKYPLVDLKKSWADMGKPMYYEMPSLYESQDLNTWLGTNYLPVDYNRDGYLDYVQFPKKGGMGTDNHRENVRFWLGKPDGSFEEDPLNDNRILGTVYSIHMKYADFNDDGYPDFCSFSSGYDRGGSTGDYPVVLMSDENCVYHDLRYPKYQEAYNSFYGNFHGGTTGDFDNDGDIDILFWNQNDILGSTSLYLENDGKGNFAERKGSDILDMTVIAATMPEKNAPMYLDCEVIDLNNDGYNDLIFSGTDVYSEDFMDYYCAPVVFWGSNSGKFGGSNYSVIPKPRLGYSINESLAFYDFNGDGIREIIVQRNADGLAGGTRFYMGTYLQVCEWENGQYVDKTEKYIPVEHIAFNRENGDIRIWIENIDGTDYFMAAGLSNFYIGLGTGIFKVYAIRNGIMESLETELKTRISSFTEGLPIYVDGPRLTDYRNCSDGVNAVDTMAEHQWVGYSDWDAPGGNMWRINFAHRKDTHFGRTCISWNRDGQDPKKEGEVQKIDFCFVSEVDLQKLADEGYFLEFYIKNTDPDLSLTIGFENFDDQLTPESFRKHYTSISSKNVEGGKYTGEWQRVLIPIKPISGEENLKIKSLVFIADDGDVNNEFYLDDIRIRRLYESGINDYDRAFMKGYLDDGYKAKDRTAQITSQEFKAMLMALVQKFAPESMNYFNGRISDTDIPLTRNVATAMAYYTALCTGADTDNYSPSGDLPEDFWDGCWAPEVMQVMPHANGDPTKPVGPGDNWWMEWKEIMQAFMWNHCHISEFSGMRVISIDKEANTYHWQSGFTWDDAICAITRLYDSLDPEKVAAGISTLKINPNSESVVYYNLQGQRVENPVKGIYIKNGKKIISK